MKILRKNKPEKLHVFAGQQQHQQQKIGLSCTAEFSLTNRMCEIIYSFVRETTTTKKKHMKQCQRMNIFVHENKILLRWWFFCWVGFSSCPHQTNKQETIACTTVF